MRKVTYASHKHEVLISTYVQLACDFAEDVSSKAKYNAYLEVVDIIIDYHNNYGTESTRQNWYDWLMIIPINLTVMTNGFFAGIENKKNRSRINSYKVLLNNMLEDIVSNIEKMEMKANG